MTPTRSDNNPLTPILLGFIAIAATALGAYVIGTIVLATGPQPVSDDQSTAPTVSDLSGSQAIILATDEDPLVMNRVTISKYNEDTTAGDPLDLSLTYRGGNSSLLITASDVNVDETVSGKDVSVTFGAHGGTYFGNDGQCTLTLEQVDYIVLEPMVGVLDGVPRGVPIPEYAGTIRCDNLDEVRTPDTLTFQGAFQYSPEN